MSVNVINYFNNQNAIILLLVNGYPTAVQNYNAQRLLLNNNVHKFMDAIGMH